VGHEALGDVDAVAAAGRRATDAAAEAVLVDRQPVAVAALGEVEFVVVVVLLNLGDVVGAGLGDVHAIAVALVNVGQVAQTVLGHDRPRPFKVALLVEGQHVVVAALLDLCGDEGGLAAGDLVAVADAAGIDRAGTSGL